MNIKVQGMQKLTGVVTPSGSKNSAVALIPATILFDKPITLHNVPEIKDVEILENILSRLGSKITWDKKKQQMTINNKNLRYKSLDSVDLASMRGTSLLWGPLLSRFKRVTFTELPAGCTLGLRPMTAHYKAFQDLGVVISENIDSVKMNATRARGKTIWLQEMSPTATENVIMLALGLKGNTTIVGAASEPQVQDLCEFLINSGADIKGVGSNVIEIKGQNDLRATDHTMWCDHYEITTFLAMAASTGGSIKINCALQGKINNILNVFESFGVKTKYDNNTLSLRGWQTIDLNRKDNRAMVIKAQPWPGLPVDTLPLFIPLALAAKKGQVLFHNWMYESGLFWTSELQKLGANVIMADPHRVIVTAGNKLYGGKMEAPYIIRAVVAMVMSAMLADGETMIYNADALYRGHPNFSSNLKKLGAVIEEIQE